MPFVLKKKEEKEERKKEKKNLTQSVVCFPKCIQTAQDGDKLQRLASQIMVTEEAKKHRSTSVFT